MTKICLELKAKHVDLVIFLRDANKEDWREVQRNDRKRCRPEQERQTVVGVADRNVECWLCHSAEWLASRCDRPAEDFRAPDPKLAFDAAFGISARDRKEDVIAGLVEEAPLARWLENPSFEDFCQQLWMMSKQRAECRLENLRERRP